MDASIIVSSPMLRLPDVPNSSYGTSESADLLRQMVELQREQIGLMRAKAAATDEKTRWQNFYNRWSGEFPKLPGQCKSVLPSVERAFFELLQEVTDRLTGDDAVELESEFALAEFLDKYGVRLAQLGNILGQVGHLANVMPSSDPPA
jgi:hypothetical protein